MGMIYAKDLNGKEAKKFPFTENQINKKVQGVKILELGSYLGILHPTSSCLGVILKTR